MADALKSTNDSFPAIEVYTGITALKDKDGTLYPVGKMSPTDKNAPVNEKTPDDELVKILRNHPDLGKGDLLVVTEIKNNQKNILGVFSGKLSEESYISSKAIITGENKVHNCEGLVLKSGWQGGGEGRLETTAPGQMGGKHIGMLNEHINEHLNKMVATGPESSDTVLPPGRTPPVQGKGTNISFGK